MSSTRKITSTIGFTNFKHFFDADKKPFLELSMDDTPENRHYLTQGGWSYAGGPYFPGGQMFCAIGKLSYEDNLIKVFIEGKSAVSAAIVGLLLEGNCANPQIKSDLKKIALNINRIKREKQFTAPLISKEHSNYTFKKINPPIFAKKNGATYSNYIYKRFNSLEPPLKKGAEIEAASAAFYRLFMGHEGAPKNVTLYQNAENIAGLLSKIIDGFSPACNHLRKLSFFDTLQNQAIYQQLIKAGIVPMLVASYVFAENDLHDSNWGFNRNLNVVRIDFTRSFWPISSKYAGIFPNEIILHEEELKHLQVKPSESFQLSADELINFPILSTSIPTNWVVGKRFARISYNLSDIRYTDQFEEQKWKYFLKATLINRSIIESIFNSYLGPSKTREKFINYLSTRLEALQTILLDLPEFHNFMLNNTQVINELIFEFEEYNKGVKEKHGFLRIDITAVKEKLDYIVAEVKKKAPPVEEQNNNTPINKPC